MTQTTGGNGRLGNQIIRNLAVSLLAEKHNLKVVYHNHDLIRKLGIELFSGDRVYPTEEQLNDDNYFSTYNAETLGANVEPNCSYFQTKDISNFLYNHLQSVQENIIEKNQFKERYNANDDLFVHIRLGDVAANNPGVNYYTNAINSIPHANLWLSTDQHQHSTVQTLLKTFPQAKLVQYKEIETFQFASTCKNVLLSHGSFSALIGYLSFFSSVHYPEYKPDQMWFGDMFSIPNWNKISY